MRVLGRTLVLLLTLGVLYSGPVAACVCADPMPAMPCCPDEPVDPDRGDFGMPGSTVVSCDPVPADLVPAGSQEIPAAAAVSSGGPPSWQTHAPPPPLGHARAAPVTARPLYLVTLRLRN